MDSEVDEAAAVAEDSAEDVVVIVAADSAAVEVEDVVDSAAAVAGDMIKDHRMRLCSSEYSPINARTTLFATIQAVKFHISMHRSISRTKSK